MNPFAFQTILLLLLVPILKYSLYEATPCFFGYSFLYDDTSKINKQDLKMMNLIPKYLPSRIAGRQQKIPYMFHQTNEMDLLTSDMVAAVEMLQQHNPEYAYRYYNGTERREFIEKHMGATVLACYDKLIPNAYKADLFRYSAIFKLGGCYADIGFVFIRPLRQVIHSNDTFISTPDGFVSRAKLNSAFFCAEAGHPILASTIRRIIQHVKASNYTHNILDITGPGAFVSGFLEYFNHSVNVSPIVAAQYENGVRLLKQNIDGGCFIYPVLVGDGTAVVYHRYPRYSADMAVYADGVHYSYHWSYRTTFDESVEVPQDGMQKIGIS